jgi:nucleoside-diphosphate-sugar epimerase
MGNRVFPNLLKGKAANVIGDPHQPHTFTYIRDFARVMVLIGETPEAAGQVWHVPSAETLTTAGFIHRVVEATNMGFRATNKISALPRWILNALSLFVPILKELKETIYQFEQPFIVDGSKAVKAFSFAPTPLREAIGETLEWYQREK